MCIYFSQILYTIFFYVSYSFRIFAVAMFDLISNCFWRDDGRLVGSSMDLKIWNTKLQKILKKVQFSKSTRSWSAISMKNYKFINILAYFSHICKPDKCMNIKIIIIIITSISSIIKIHRKFPETSTTASSEKLFQFQLSFCRFGLGK